MLQHGGSESAHVGRDSGDLLGGRGPNMPYAVKHLFVHVTIKLHMGHLSASRGVDIYHSPSDVWDHLVFRSFAGLILLC